MMRDIFSILSSSKTLPGDWQIRRIPGQAEISGSLLPGDLAIPRELAGKKF